MRADKILTRHTPISRHAQPPKEVFRPNRGSGQERLSGLSLKPSLDFSDGFLSTGKKPLAIENIASNKKPRYQSGSVWASDFLD